MAELAPSPTRGSDLQIIAEYDLQNGGKLSIALGDIVTYEGGAIVNAANRGCQGGGGVDGAITRPAATSSGSCGGGSRSRSRASTTAARRVTPCGRPPRKAPLGRLNVKTVIHAVGPDYAEKGMSHAESDGLLRKAYGAAIREAGAAKVESVAFPLISAKIFRGNRDLAGLLELSLDALVTAADASSSRRWSWWRSRRGSPTPSSRGGLARQDPTEAAAHSIRAARAPDAQENEGRRRRPHERHLGGGRVAAGQVGPTGPVDLTTTTARRRQAQGARRARLARPHDR